MALPHIRSNRLLEGLACGMGAGALWGLVFLAPALAHGFSPLELAVGRYLAYGVMAALLLAPRWRAVKAQIGLGEWRQLARLGLLGNTLYYILLAGGVQQGGMAMTSLVIGFLPVVISLIGSRDHGAVPLRRLGPSLLLSFGGVSCIAWQSLAAEAGQPHGNGWIGLACATGALASWSAFAIGNSRCLARLRHIAAQDWNLLLGLVTGLQALLLVPLACVVAAWTAPGLRDARQWWQWACLSVAVALLASIMGNGLWNRMSRLLPLTLSGQMILAETLFALLYGFLWEARWPTGLEVAAMLLLTGGVSSCVWAHRPRHASGITGSKNKQ